MLYSVDPANTFAAAVGYYEEYSRAAKKNGKKPVSFINFIFGRY